MTYPCPCCGFLEFKEPPGSDEICPICFWQDDEVSLRYPTIAVGGPNKLSLVEAQQNFSAHGVSEPRFRARVRAPTAADRRDPGWHQIDPRIDVLDTPDEAGATPWPDDKTRLYYWRPDYWLRRPAVER